MATFQQVAGDDVAHVMKAPGQGLCSPRAALQTPFAVPGPQEVSMPATSPPSFRAPVPTIVGHSLPSLLQGGPHPEHWPLLSLYLQVRRTDRTHGSHGAVQWTAEASPDRYTSRSAVCSSGPSTCAAPQTPAQKVQGSHARPRVCPLRQAPGRHTQEASIRVSVEAGQQLCAWTLEVPPISLCLRRGTGKGLGGLAVPPGCSVEWVLLGSHEWFCRPSAIRLRSLPAHSQVSQDC